MASVQHLPTFDDDIQAVDLQSEESKLQRGCLKGTHAEDATLDNVMAPIQHHSTLDDDIQAIVLQLEESELQRNSQLKYAEDAAPDNNMACVQQFSIIDNEIQAIGFQLELIELQRGSKKQKHAEDMASLDFVEEQLRADLLVLQDQKLAHSMAYAVDVDAPTIEQFRASELQAAHDRMFVLRLTNEDPELEKAANSEVLVVEDDTKKPHAWWTTDGLGSNDDEMDPSISYTSHQIAAFKKLSQYSVECVACGENSHPKDAISLSCDHIYCKVCLRSLFISATTDESLFPPRCCRQRVDLSLTKTILSDDELVEFEEAEIEFTTTNRVYCAEVDCGKFIPPNNVYPNRECAVCPKCEAETCVHCKDHAHEGACVADEALQDLLTLATKQGWRRCLGCNTMIERDLGCNHMTCKCSAQFCYLCGLKWKDCGCDMWEEHNLLRRAEEVVDREATGAMLPMERQARVRDMRDILEANHECEHRGRWEKRENQRDGARHHCDVCGDTLYKYILVCPHCRMTACKRCRRNRI